MIVCISCPVNICADAGVVCLKYHAGIPIAQRREAHHKFLRDEVQVLVYVLHYVYRYWEPIAVYSGTPLIWRLFSLINLSIYSTFTP